MLHFLTRALVRQLEVVVDHHSLLVCTTRRESETNITGHSLVVTQAQAQGGGQILTFSTSSARLT